MTEQANNNAYYYEICILRLLFQMGYLNNKEVEGIAKIAAEDYNATLVVDKNFFYPKR